MRWKPALVLIGVLLLGGVAGVISDRAYLQYLESRKLGGGRAVRSPAKLLDGWTKKFDLTPAQRVKILPILKAYRLDRWQQILRYFGATNESVAKLRREVRPTLNPDQIERYERFWKKFLKIRARRRNRKYGAPPP